MSLGRAVIFVFRLNFSAHLHQAMAAVGGLQLQIHCVDSVGPKPFEDLLNRA